MSNATRERADDGQIELLLPWYVTGKLETDERLAVEAALARSPALRRQLELVREEIDAAAQANETARPRAGATDRFMAMLNNGTSPRPARQSVVAWLMQWLAGPPRWAVAAGALAIVAQFAVIGGLVTERQLGGYHTAGGPGTPAEGTLVLARFADTASLSAVTGQLAGLGVTIVDGPKADGIFTLRIGPKDMPQAERDRRLAALRSNTATMVFIGPLQ